MKRPVNATWCLSSNVGDNITRYLIEKITGLPPFYLDISDPAPKIMGCGSTLGWMNDSCYVWGSGASTADTRINAGKMNIFSLRGPISRDIVIANGGTAPENYGDPGLLLPMYYRSPVMKKYRLGVIPHYIEQNDFFSTFGYPNELGGALFIDVFAPVEDFIDRVCSCRAILSSSLHGLVIADAYGIPSRRMALSDKILGDGTKYADYYASIDVSPPPVLTKAEVSDLVLNNVDPVGPCVKNKITLSASPIIAAFSGALEAMGEHQ